MSKHNGSVYVELVIGNKIETFKGDSEDLAQERAIAAARSDENAFRRAIIRRADSGAIIWRREGY